MEQEEESRAASFTDELTGSSEGAGFASSSGVGTERRRLAPSGKAGLALPWQSCALGQGPKAGAAEEEAGGGAPGPPSLLLCFSVGQGSASSEQERPPQDGQAVLDVQWPRGGEEGGSGAGPWLPPAAAQLGWM